MSDSGSEASVIEGSDLFEGSSSGESDAEDQQVAGCESASEHGGSDKAVSEATSEASDGNGDDRDRDFGEEDDSIGKLCSMCGTQLDVSMLETADECLDCDGGCGRELPPSEMRIRCGFGGIDAEEREEGHLLRQEARRVRWLRVSHHQDFLRRNSSQMAPVLRILLESIFKVVRGGFHAAPRSTMAAPASRVRPTSHPA